MLSTIRPDKLRKQLEKKPQLLNGKEGYVDSWQIRDKKDVHPSHLTKVFEAEDIKSACEFYLRYKDKPELLIKEYPKYKKEVDNLYIIEEKLKPMLIYTKFEKEDYNEWLFKLAFKDALGEK